MKLLNNFVSMGYAALYAEALMIGAKAGLSAKVFDARHPRRPDGLPLLSHLLPIRARARPRGASLHHRQRLQGRHLSRRRSPRRSGSPIRSAPRCATISRSPSAPVMAEDYVPMLSDLVAQWNGVSPASPPN